MNIIEQYITTLMDERKSRSTIKNHRGSIKKFCEWLSNQEGVHRGDGVSADPRLATQLDIKNFKTFEEQRSKPNTLRMTLTHVQLSDRKGKVIVRKGKWGRYREVPLNVDTRRVLAKYIEECVNNPYALNSEYLFTSQRSPKLSTRAIQHLFAKYQQLTGIDHLTAHALRHTFCHELVSRKIPLDVVARLAGHMKNNGMPNIEMTLVYTQPNEDDLARAVEELSWV